MSEFDLISRLQASICAPGARYRSGCTLGIGDDAALLQPPPDRELVICTDSLVEGVHFPVRTPAAAVGHKALAVNLSDLAAMGAEPAWFLLALTVPSEDPEWLDGFADGMASLAASAGIYLVGGDVTSGPMNVCVTALGLVEPGRSLTRSGARPGDLVAVSGRPGAAARALRDLQLGREPCREDRSALEYPVARLALGRALAGLATSCIDLSDGLLADLGHILTASGVAAELELGRMPCPRSMIDMHDGERWPLQLSGGDDYELCFTVPPAAADQLRSIQEACACELTVIGRITAGSGLVVRKPDGGLYHAATAGYEHFQDRGKADP